MECPLTQLDSGKWWCPDCDPKKKRLLPRKARRNCRAKRKPMTDEDREAALQLCRTNRCGNYVLKGKLDVCAKKRCSGRTYPSPITGPNGLLDGGACPDRHW
jgi:hypothetical protein